MSRRKIRPSHFVAIWELSPSIRVAAAALQQPVRKVRAMARHLRNQGVRLKEMSTSKPLTITQFATDHAN